MNKKKQAAPIVASWESTLACDLRCKHCGLEAGKPRKNELKTSEARKMIINLSNLGIKNLCISGGEFTVRHDWKELLRLALQLHDEVRIITNGRLGESLIPILEKMPHAEKLMISLSLDGMQKTHDKRRAKGSHDLVRQILEQPTSIPKTVITTVAQDNFSELPEILVFCLERNVTIWSIQLSLPEGRMQKDWFLGKEKIQVLADMIHLMQEIAGQKMVILPDDCFGYLHPMREQEPWIGCHAGKELISILSDGSVTGCPTLMDQICGNIREQSLEKIWSGPKMANLRNSKITTCQTCQGCPGGCKTVQKVIGHQLCLAKGGQNDC